MGSVSENYTLSQCKYLRRFVCDPGLLFHKHRD